MWRAGSAGNRRTPESDRIAWTWADRGRVRRPEHRGGAVAGDSIACGLRGRWKLGARSRLSLRQAHMPATTIEWAGCGRCVPSCASWAGPPVT